MTEYKVVPVEITPKFVQERILVLRRCQAYISKLPAGREKDDLHKAINMAFMPIHDILNEHGIEEFDDMVAFEKGNFALWDRDTIRGQLQ